MKVTLQADVTQQKFRLLYMKTALEYPSSPALGAESLKKSPTLKSEEASDVVPPSLDALSSHRLNYGDDSKKPYPIGDRRKTRSHS